MRFRTALALGGGGARGFAHIGVLKVLQKELFPIDLIVGTSMGAIVGGGYALSLDITLLEKKIKELIDSKIVRNLESFLSSSAPEEKKLLIGKFIDFIKATYLWNVKRTKKWLVDSASLIELLETLIPQKKSFFDAKIPFACIATDLLKGKTVLFKEGKLLESILASCALPGIFSPIKIKDRLLIDGGIVSPLPAKEAKDLGADFVIGVNVESLRLREEFRSGVDIILQADQIRAYHFSRMGLNQCDFLLSPQVAGLSWADFSKVDFCIQKGIEATEKAIVPLKRLLRRRRLRSVFGKLLRFRN